MLVMFVNGCMLEEKEVITNTEKSGKNLIFGLKVIK